ncbi:HAMP domain-containing protein, partial [bacterium]|nr:HAMP domain-containing protein [bacterium]
MTDATEGNVALQSAQAETRAALDRLLSGVRGVVDTFAATQKRTQDRATEALEATNTQAVAMPAVAILLGITFALVIGASIARPIRRLTTVMVALAGGDKSVQVPAVDNHDEVGDMARAVQVFKDNAIEMDRLRDAQERE